MALLRIDCGDKLVILHIWSESNLVNFEIPEGLNIVLGSSWPLYCESRMELDLAKNVPFQKFQ